MTIQSAHQAENAPIYPPSADFAARAKMDAEDPLVILCTAGSTDMPKRVAGSDALRADLQLWDRSEIAEIESDLLRDTSTLADPWVVDDFIAQRANV